MPPACRWSTHACGHQEGDQTLNDATGLSGGDSRSPLLDRPNPTLKDATGLPGGNSRLLLQRDQAKMMPHPHNS
jgi:hypothetical protein